MKFVSILATALVTVAVFVSLPSNSLASPPTQVDGQSEDSTTTSLRKMFTEHGNKEVCLLRAAIVRIQIGDKEQQAAATGNKDASPTSLGSKINGMTYKEIIAFSTKYPDKVTPLCRD